MAGMSVAGISSNGLLIDNDIILRATLNSPDVANYFTISVYNLTTGINAENFRFYSSINNSISVNISPILKSTFNKPEHNTNYGVADTTETNNSNQIRVIVSINYTDGETTGNIFSNQTRNYIRGGKRTLNTNIRIPIGTKLRTSTLVPVWPGYPTSSYEIASDWFITRKTIFTEIEQLRSKTCDPVYIKFLNSLGGYSYWLFETSTFEESNDNLGVISNYGSITDLGNDVEFNLTVQSKVPERYISYISDLISSPEIYRYIPGQTQENAWERLISDNNKNTIITGKDVYGVKLKFQRYYNYKPAVIW